MSSHFVILPLKKTINLKIGGCKLLKNSRGKNPWFFFKVNLLAKVYWWYENLSLQLAGSHLLAMCLLHI